MEAMMTPQEALKIFGLAEFPKTSDELRRLHKKLALKCHPDRGGSLDKMKEINAANDILKKNIGGSIRNVTFGASGPVRTKGFGGMHCWRKYGQTFPKGEVPPELPKEEVCRKMRLHMLTFFNSSLRQDAVRSYLEEFVHQKFTSEITTTQGLKFEETKEPWMKAIFTSQDKSVSIVVSFTGNSDRKAYKERDSLEGYFNKESFDFEWKLEANAFVNGKKKILLKPVRYHRKDAAVLGNPAAFLPSDKLIKIFGRK